MLAKLEEVRDQGTLAKQKPDFSKMSPTHSPSQPAGSGVEKEIFERDRTRLRKLTGFRPRGFRDPAKNSAKMKKLNYDQKIRDAGTKWCVKLLSLWVANTPPENVRRTTKSEVPSDIRPKKSQQRMGRCFTQRGKGWSSRG